MYEYKTVPSPKALTVRNSKEDDNAIRAFSNIMNEESRDGWEFYSMETINVTEPGGCLGAGQASRQVSYNMLVFRRTKQP